MICLLTLVCTSQVLLRYISKLKHCKHFKSLFTFTAELRYNRKTIKQY